MEDNTLLKTVSVDDVEYSYTIKETRLFRGIVREYDVRMDSTINSLHLYCSVVRDVIKNITGMRRIILYIYYPPLHDERRITIKDSEIVFESPRKLYKGNRIDYTFFRVKLTSFNHLM